MFVRGIILWYALFWTKQGQGYTIYTADDPNVCNQSIYLEHGPNSAAILKLTARDSYPLTPFYCTIHFKAPIHKWSGLTGVLEQVDLRKYEDEGHRLGQSFCVDYITIMTEKPNSGPNEKQCGTWSITPGKPLSRLGYKRALVGYCPHSAIAANAEKCHVTELKVIVSVGRAKKENLWRNVSWNIHTGFTFVVTAYSYPIKHGESECRDGLRSCSQANTPGARLGVYHCVHNSLWCDGHINCGLLENMDELSCFKNGILGGLVTVVIGPWMGASMFLLMVFCGILYWRSSRWRMTTREPLTNNTQPEINSYAESYELSSNVSSAHHMAIQVRVVCNSNHPHHGDRGALQPWKDDLPPSYEALFPQGPPQANSPIANIVATVSQDTIGGNTVSRVGLNVSSTTSLPSSVVSAAPETDNFATNITTISNLDTVQPSTSDITSIIDLNVTSNNIQPPSIFSGVTEARKISTGVDAIVTAAGSNQTSVTLTLTPSHNLNRNELCPVTRPSEFTSPSHSVDVPGIDESSILAETNCNDADSSRHGISDSSHESSLIGEQTRLPPEINLICQSNLNNFQQSN